MEDQKKPDDLELPESEPAAPDNMETPGEPDESEAEGYEEKVSGGFGSFFKIIVLAVIIIGISAIYWAQSRSTLDRLSEEFVDAAVPRKMEIIGEFAETGSRNAVGVLTQLIYSQEDPLVRERICEELGNMGLDLAIGPLRQNLEEDKDVRVRLKAAWALNRIGSEKAKKVLGKVAETGKDPFARMRAQFYLKMEEDKDIVPQLIGKLEAPDPLERKQAILYLAVRENPEIIPALITGLGDEDENVRLSIVLALREKESPEVEKALEEHSKTETSDQVLDLLK